MKPSMLAIIKKEFYAYVNAPLAYVVIVPFLLVSNFLFFRTALVLGDANLRPFIELLPWFMIVMGSALAMRSFTEEIQEDTLELLYAHPVSEWTIVIGKLIGLLAFYGLILLSTITLPLTLIAFGQPDYGLMFTQYLGAFFAGAAFLSLGLVASAYVRSSVGSFLTGAAMSFVLVMLGLNFVTLMFPRPFNLILNELSVMNHVNSISRGVIDVRDLLYFVTLIGLAVTACVLRLSRRKVDESQAEKRKLVVAFGLILAIGIAGNIVLYREPFRIDLTANRRFSMSSGTKQLLANLPDRVTLNYYVSNNLPGPMQVTAKEVADRLKDFSRYGNSKLVINQILAITPEQQSEADKAGIQQVTFNQIATSSFQVQQGYHGIQVRYGDKTDTLPFIEDASDLEYQLSRTILSLTRNERPQLGLVDLTTSGAYNQLQTVLQDQYQLTTVSENSTEVNWDELSAVVVIDDGSAEHATASAQLKTYLDNKGKALILVDGVSIEQQMLTVTPSSSSILQLLKDKGVNISKDLVYDLQLNEPITLGQGNLRYVVAYPFWIRALLNQEAIPWGQSVENVLLGWPSSLTINQDDTNVYGLKPLLNTSAASNVQTSNFTIRPEELKSLQAPSGETYTVGAVGEKDGQRLMVVANTLFVSDDFLQNTPVNVGFLANAVDWVAADEILSSIPKRTGGRSVFTFASVKQAQMIQYLNIGLPPVLVTIAGIVWLKRRRNRTMRHYTALSN